MRVGRRGGSASVIRNGRKGRPARRAGERRKGKLLRAAHKFWRAARAVPVFAVVGLLVAQLSAAPSALAQGQATPAPDDLVKFVILSRHGVRSPIPSPAELATWTKSIWPNWYCTGGVKCLPGYLTLQGIKLAQQMGEYYRNYLAGLFPLKVCPPPDKVFVWADHTERTERTGQWLLDGFGLSSPSCDMAKSFHTAANSPDRIFHPVGEGSCTLDPERAEQKIIKRAGGSLQNFKARLAAQLQTAQNILGCCQAALCQKTWSETCLRPTPPYPKACTLTDDNLLSCVARSSSELGGALKVGSTFSEILLLEYANGFEGHQLGWGQITPGHLRDIFLLHTAVFDLEQRTKYIAKRRGALLLKKILLALEGENDGQEGTAPANAKFVAYVGHDTNIANVAAMLGLSWQQDGYQENQTLPAGALVFELHSGNGQPYVSVSYVAQSLDDMHNKNGTSAVRTPVPIPDCGNSGICSLGKFRELVKHALARAPPGCSQ